MTRGIKKSVVVGLALYQSSVHIFHRQDNSVQGRGAIGAPKGGFVAYDVLSLYSLCDPLPDIGKECVALVEVS